MTKALKVKLNTTSHQRKLLDNWLHTSRHVYNKSIFRIKKGEQANFYNLRNELVTDITGKKNNECIEVEQIYEQLNNCKKHIRDSKNSYKEFLKVQKKLLNKKMNELKKESEKLIKAQLTNYKKRINKTNSDSEEFDKCRIKIKELNQTLTETISLTFEYEYVVLRLKKIDALMVELNPESQEFEDLQIRLKMLESLYVERNKTLQAIKKTLPKVKNENVKEWELETPKDIRAGAVNDACKALKSATANLKAGNIKFFNLNYKKKTQKKQCMVIPSMLIKNNNGVIQIAKTYLKEHNEFKMGKRTIKKDEYKNMNIECDCRLVKEKREYWLFVPVKIPEKKIVASHSLNYCGVDPGVRTLMTVFGNNGCTEYTHNEYLTDALDNKIKFLKSKRKIVKRKKTKEENKINQISEHTKHKGKKQKKPSKYENDLPLKPEDRKKNRVRKRKINKVEKRKSNITDEIQWKSINELLKSNDVIFFGDIKSHNLVKDKHNRNLNRRINNMKFYQFKQRLLFKSIEKNKHVVFVEEHYTTKTCSFCGKLNNPKASKIYSCGFCKKHVGRDENAAKNILIKGIVEWENVILQSSASKDDIYETV
jgi:putative transposase